MPRVITPLRRALFESERTQRAIAEQVGIHEAHLSRIANGLQCNDATRQAIAAALGVEVAAVFPEPPSTDPCDCGR